MTFSAVARLGVAIAVLGTSAGAFFAGEPATATASSTSVIVRERSPLTAAAENAVRRVGGRVMGELPLVGGFAARVPEGARSKLARVPAITAVWRDGVVAVHSVSDCPATDPTCFDALPPNAVWEEAIGLSSVPHRYSGSGVTVGLIDTGVTPNTDLGTRLLARADLTSEHDGIDRFGHGSHLSGLIAGDGTLSAEKYEGAATEANLVSIRVAGWDGATDVSTVIAGLQWAVANRDRYGIRVLNLSFGTDAVQSATTDPLDYAVEQVWRAGIVVVVAAGNRCGAAGTVSKPGDDPFVITVGAADLAGAASPSDDSVASFSSRGPTQDGFAKPDLLAPGVSLVSTRAPGSVADVFRPAARVGINYFKGSGTSQAAAIVSGVVARMLDANPALTPDQVKGVLMQTAHHELPGRAGGAGLVDAAAAVNAVVPPKKGPAPALPQANGGIQLGTGLGTIEASRGSQHVFRDLDGDGLADPLAGEIDALGAPWSPRAYVATAWAPGAWSASAWAPLTAEVTGSAPAPVWTGPLVPLLAWEAKYWGATSWSEAGWDAKYWGSAFWGSKYWGTGFWQ